MPDNEVATLLWPVNSIVGDAYTAGSNFDNFAFYGRNLNQSSTTLRGSDYTWGTSGYKINPEAQSSYLEDQQKYFDDRIAQLSGEGQVISSATLNSNPTWNLQRSDGNIGLINNAVNTYPDGKVWAVSGDVVISGTKTYSGKGTIIFNGNLTTISIIVETDINYFLYCRQHIGFYVVHIKLHNSNHNLYKPPNT